MHVLPGLNTPVCDWMLQSGDMVDTSTGLTSTQLTSILQEVRQVPTSHAGLCCGGALRRYPSRMLWVYLYGTNLINSHSWDETHEMVAPSKHLWISNNNP